MTAPVVLPRTPVSVFAVYLRLLAWRAFADGHFRAGMLALLLSDAATLAILVALAGVR